jgi:S-adenosylmethionine hydrolase
VPPRRNDLVVARPITFLSDYGTADEFVGVVHAVIARLAPDARVIDLAHGIPRHGVVQGALTLARTLAFAPAGVHLAVVDPGVGGARRAVALRTAEEERVLVGPDNGLLVPAAERFGGIAQAVDVSASPWRLEPVSATFHGRDVFAPVAARLARGEPLTAAGAPLDAAALVPLSLRRPRAVGGGVVAVVAGVDTFGNVQLLAGREDLELVPGVSVRVSAGENALRAVVARTFADVAAGEAILYADSSHALAIAINKGDAAAALGVRAGDEVCVAAG